MKHVNTDGESPNEELTSIYENVMMELGQPMVGMAIKHKAGITLLIEWDSTRKIYVTNQGQAITLEDTARLKNVLGTALTYLFTDQEAAIHIVADDCVLQLVIGLSGDLNVFRVDAPNLCSTAGFQRDFKRGQ